MRLDKMRPELVPPVLLIFLGMAMGGAGILVLIAFSLAAKITEKPVSLIVTIFCVVVAYQLCCKLVAVCRRGG